LAIRPHGKCPRANQLTLDAFVSIEGQGRAGLERLLRYWACPAFVLERLERVSDNLRQQH
jgi:hypothetical protein